jgi:membrane protein required for colicin V production
MLRDAVHSTWFAAVVSLIVVFVVAFIALRLIGAAIARRVQNTQMLGFLDRSLGLLIGLGRGLIVLGALFLMFNAATPQDLRPKWITGAHTWPLAESMGGVLERLAPQGMDVAGRLKPAFDRAWGKGSGDRSTTDGYEAREPASADRPERSR